MVVSRPKSSHGVGVATAPPLVTGPDARESDAATSDCGKLDVVGVGASAGGLDAFTKLMDALGPAPGMAFILVQHLDPMHVSLIAGLLASHTGMVVVEAEAGAVIQRNHVYVIPPGKLISVRGDRLVLSSLAKRTGARLAFDFLLRSLADVYGARAACIVLSGSGSDGTVGARALKAAGGLVLVQKPGEAGESGMPSSAIEAGVADLVLSIRDMPEALLVHQYGEAKPGDCDVDALEDISDGPDDGLDDGADNGADDGADDGLDAIIELLRAATVTDFRAYKPGTLRRRIERRMTYAGIKKGEHARYLATLAADADELGQLARDLLINVTRFFRDPDVFEALASTVIPDLLSSRPPDGTLRVWIAGCSSGEETYSLAMLFSEAIATSGTRLKVQFFASDVDPEAVALARDGRYPAAIEADITPSRLARFFSKVDQGYRVSPDLRAQVVFTVQDVLSDPPFSRLDMVSCRNLLIYLRPEAQAKVISIFDFALKDTGILLLGSAESIGDPDGRFGTISKYHRIYRHARARPATPGTSARATDGARPKQSVTAGQRLGRQATTAELVKRIVLETHGPAAVLINASNECLYSTGPTDKFLRVVAGHPTQDLFAMVRPALRARLRAATQRARAEKARVTIEGGRTEAEGYALPSARRTQQRFEIDVQPLVHAGEDLLLVCFTRPHDGSASLPPGGGVDAAAGSQGAAVGADPALQRDLDSARAELEVAMRELELSSQEQNAIREESLSVDEEHQAANEELVTSKEELQALNEELTALNGQLQETLERQRTTADDLQNVLYSTDVATLFLDTELRIRFFTPATRSLFNLIPGDVGRPLADLNSLALDGALAADARAVLRDPSPVEREIETPGRGWFTRRISPYRAHDGGVEGVVITFTDVTERKQVARALEQATQRSEQANGAKSRFLAAASHDLRQPLQTLGLLNGLLAKRVRGEEGSHLIARVDETLGAMSGMLNTLLDINQIEAGIVRAEVTGFAANDLLDRIRDEFTCHAEDKALSLQVIPCSLAIESDPRLLEQMVRNLVSNALKYTESGRVLLGCRRHASTLVFELWDTGIGIPAEELASIFEEYHQLGNPARERSRGLGLGLAIVQRLGKLLGHRVSVRSRPAKGSVFSIEVALSSRAVAAAPREIGMARPATARRGAVILIVEDDREVRELLELSLKEEGHRPVTAVDGNDAYTLVVRGPVVPDLLLADYNLPNGPNGLQLALRLRERLGADFPVIILTGDISTGTLREVERHRCAQLNKPVQVSDLNRTILRLLPDASRATPPAANVPAVNVPAANVPAEAGLAAKTRSRVCIVDDDPAFRAAMGSLIEESGRAATAFANGEAFLEAYRPQKDECILIDAYMPGMSGIELLRRLRQDGHQVPVIMITGLSDVPTAVQAMRAGASDFFEKPTGAADLLASVERALEQSRDANKLTVWRLAAAAHVAALTPRQRQVMALVLAGHPSKNIAADLDISQRTVENHRASIMKRTGTASLPALARLALAASHGVDDEDHDDRL